MDHSEKPEVNKNRRRGSSSSTQADRTAQTRASLLKAAETIFARDGFEAARLEEIAARAGYTRGALYANFAGKEDLFIALLAEELDRRMALFRERAAQRTSLALPVEVLRSIVRQNYIHVLRDRTWNILFLEYKLFVMRHPEFKDKISEMQSRTLAITASVLDEIFAGAGVEPPVSTLAAGTALADLANTIGLDLAIGRAITENEADTVLGLFFDAISGGRVE